MASMSYDKTGSAKQEVSKIKEGIGKGSGYGGEVDPTKQAPANTPPTPWDWNSDSELKPNRNLGGTKSF